MHASSRNRAARVEYALPQEAASARWARRLTSGFLGHPAMPDGVSGRVDEAVLIVSELVTNAVRHGNSRCRLRLSAASSGVTIEVHDDDPHTPAVKPLTEDATGGRGMAIVGLLARQFDITADRGGGKTVRAVLAGT
ncbi:ATP-binding protein [Streptomyces niger]|uniref:ATP-binding protein n=1 Tax=Streptomyces niger TaxID=66373 RepID=UPI00069A8031|nr:ATP-binding protein [Streptomyces niger]